MTDRQSQEDRTGYLISQLVDGEPSREALDELNELVLSDTSSARLVVDHLILDSLLSEELSRDSLATLIDFVADRFAKEGADIWFDEPADKLLPPKTSCPQCGGKNFSKETDILDVWFDSGVSWAAVLENDKNLKFPCDLYLEGSDQHRGWFHSSLLAAVGTRGTPPYTSVLTHGFVVDGEGKKMSKSAGNVVAPAEVIQKFGKFRF